jgi:type IV pilus assembly protein PilM
VFELEEEEETILPDFTSLAPPSEEPAEAPEAEAGAEAPAEEAAVTPPVPLEGDEERQKREIYDAMLPVLGELVTEIRRSLEYYRSRHEGAEVHRLILVGGTARLPGLPEFLSEELGIPAERGDPVVPLTVANPHLSDELLHELSPVLAVAIGLAVRDLMD